MLFSFHFLLYHEDGNHLKPQLTFHVIALYRKDGNKNFACVVNLVFLLKITKTTI